MNKILAVITTINFVIGFGLIMWCVFVTTGE